MAALVAFVCAVGAGAPRGPAPPAAAAVGPAAETDSAAARDSTAAVGSAAARDSTAAVGSAAARDSTAAAGSAAATTRLTREALLAGRGDGRGQVLEPGGIAVDPFGRIYVTDAALHRLQRLDADGGFLGVAGALGSRPGELRRPGAVALLGALGVAVLDRENRRIASYDLFGRFQGVLVDLAAESLADEVGRVDPIDLAADRGGALYVADADGERLLVFDFAGTYLRAIGGFGGKPGSFRGLAGVAAGPDGVIVTVERGEGRMQRLDAGGRPIGHWPLDVASSGAPLGVAVSDGGAVAIADAEGGRILWFDAPGAPPVTVEAGAPRAVAFAGEGRLLVAADGEVARYAIVRATPAGRSE
jgi:sugar lactone lactonase YvrE